jgi:hypothetical protein
MLWIASELAGYAIEATDGRIGSAEDFLFDDRHWMVRWAVVDTGDWLPGRSVLLPPSQLVRADPKQRVLKVALTRDQVEHSPDIASDPPVSRRHEELIYDYYGWAPYWHAGFLAPGPMPALYAAGAKPRASAVAVREGEPSLRSTSDVMGYYVHARDGDIGHIADFLIDNDNWAIRYLVIDTRNWWPGKKVLVAPHWVSSISWPARTVRFDATRQRIKSSPDYDPAAFDRGYEARLHAHYDMPTYWL